MAQMQEVVREESILPIQTVEQQQAERTRHDSDPAGAGTAAAGSQQFPTKKHWC